MKKNDSMGLEPIPMEWETIYRNYFKENNLTPCAIIVFSLHLL